MIQIPLGNEFIETDVINLSEFTELASDPCKNILARLLREQAQKSIVRLREKIVDGDLNSAIAEEFTAKTFEDIAQMLETGLTQARDPQS